MKFLSESKLLIGIAAASLVIILIGVFFFSQPEKKLGREEIIGQTINFKGPKEAGDYLVEFSDFQCPACKAYKGQVDSLIEKYQDKLLFVYRHFPLPQHQFGSNAAKASEAAANQGKFWPMYDYLFENQEKLSEAIIASGAAVLNLDIDKFQQDYRSAEIVERVNKDLSDSNRLGVNATPTFFLNGQKLNLLSVNDLTVKVEEALKN